MAYPHAIVQFPMMSTSTTLIHGDGLILLKTQMWDHIISDPDYDHQTDVEIYRQYCSGNIVLFCDPRRRPKSTVNPDEVLFWSKAQSTKWPSKRFNTFVEEILVFKGKKPIFNKLHWTSMSGLFTDSFVTKPEHPYTKPLSLMEKLVIAYTNPGDMVFDPFSGSGTTALACKNLGRRFMGAEIDPKFFQLATDRLAI